MAPRTSATRARRSGTGKGQIEQWNGSVWNLVNGMAAQTPGVCVPLAALSVGQFVGSGASAFGSSTARGCRFVAPMDGTITAVATPLTTASGNFDLAMLDTTASTRTVVTSTGSTACPSVAAAGMTVLKSGLSWSVTAGQQFDVAVVFDNATAAANRWALGATALNQLPTGWMSSGVTSGSPKQALTWSATITVGSWGSSLAESSITAAAYYPLYLLIS